MGRVMELLQNHSYSQVVKMTGISKSMLIREKTGEKDKKWD